jgi:hypothetical protein
MLQLQNREKRLTQTLYVHSHLGRHQDCELCQIIKHSALSD